MPKTINYSLLTIHYNAARLYHSTASVWLSVDPLSDKYPNLSPYTYCANNPVRLVDPDGRDIWEVNEYGYSRCIEKSSTEHKIFFTTEKSENSFGVRLSTRFGKNKQEVCIDNENVDALMEGFHSSISDGHISSFIGNDKNEKLAQDFMKAVSIYTEVEWGYTGSNNGMQFISTSHKVDEDLCSSNCANMLANQGELSFALHIHHKYNFASFDDWKSRQIIGASDAIFGIIYQQKLFDFRGANMSWTTNHHK